MQLKDVLGPGKRRGQAVMEYLITYGLALFVILIVLAILVAVVFPSLRAPEACQFTQPGFSCNQNPHTIVASTDGDNLRLLIELSNTQGKSVVVKGILCTDEPIGNIQRDDIELWSTEVQFAAGQAKTIGGENSDIQEEILCTKGGTAVKLAPNSNFKGSMGVLYKFYEDHPDAPDRIAAATISGIVQEEAE